MSLDAWIHGSEGQHVQNCPDRPHPQYSSTFYAPMRVSGVGSYSLLRTITNKSLKPWALGEQWRKKVLSPWATFEHNASMPALARKVGNISGHKSIPGQVHIQGSIPKQNQRIAWVQKQWYQKSSNNQRSDNQEQDDSLPWKLVSFLLHVLL